MRDEKEQIPPAIVLPLCLIIGCDEMSHYAAKPFLFVLI
jgi:hypothetical protein